MDLIKLNIDDIRRFSMPSYYWWMRSADLNWIDHTANVYHTGHVHCNNVINDFGITPVCKIT